MISFEIRSYSESRRCQTKFSGGVNFHWLVLHISSCSQIGNVTHSFCSVSCENWVSRLSLLIVVLELLFDCWFSYVYYLSRLKSWRWYYVEDTLSTVDCLIVVAGVWGPALSCCDDTVAMMGLVSMIPGLVLI